MTIFTSQELLAGLRRDTEELIRIANEKFVPLRPEGLFWQPAPDKWSIAGCLEHLNRYGLHYIPHLERGIATAVAGGSRPETLFQSGWLGNFLIRSVQPRGTGSSRANLKYPSPKAYNPNRTGTVPPDALPEFLRQQRALLKVLNEASRVNLAGVRIPVSVTNLVQLKLGDCLRFVIVHNQRHVQQAQKVLAAGDFPVATKLRE